MLTLESLRLRIMLLLKLPQLFRAIALGCLLLLDALALELLQLDIVLVLQRSLLHAMLALYRLAHRVIPIGMTLQGHRRDSFCAHQWTSCQTCLSS